MENLGASSASGGRNVGGKNTLSDVRGGEAQPPTSGQPTIKTPEKGGAKIPPYKVSAHACTWRYCLEGEPKRGEFREILLRNGVKVRYWRFMGCKLQACKKTLFIFVKTGKRAASRQALYAAWNKADLARRAFSAWQQVGLREQEQPHLAGAVKAHLVIEGGAQLQAVLNPLAPVKPALPLAVRSKLCRDKSHNLKPEFENIDAGAGLDYLLLDFPLERKEEAQLGAERWAETQAGFNLLRAENAKLAEGLGLIARHLALLQKKPR